jgi:hypothetical protein
MAVPEPEPDAAIQLETITQKQTSAAPNTSNMIGSGLIPILYQKFRMPVLIQDTGKSLGPEVNTASWQQADKHRR